MKAIVQERYGSPDDLELREVEKPVVGDDDVFAEYVSVPQDLLALKPDNITFQQAASVHSLAGKRREPSILAARSLLVRFKRDVASSMRRFHRAQFRTWRHFGPRR